VRKSPAAEPDGIVLKKEAPEVTATFNNLFMSLVASKGLDAKSKQLTCIAMKASMGDEMAVRESLCRWQRQLGRQKRKCGCHTQWHSRYLGIRGVVTCLREAARKFKNNCSVL